MDFSLDNWHNDFRPSLLAEMAGLWNRNAAGRHSFQLWDASLLAGLLNDEAGNGIGAARFARAPGGELTGWIHISIVSEPGYARAGVVEMLMVDARFRRQGLGTRLLASGLEFLAGLSPRPDFADALGAWPYGYVYNCLADGSERSGVFMSQPEVYRLFRRAGFEAVRKSLVMRADLSGSRPRPLPAGTRVQYAPRRENNWLDRVFRGRKLWDHNLVDAAGNILSRAIFAFMEGESRHEGRGVFSLFGVNTPHDLQRRGYAGVNLSRLMARVEELGGSRLELHVYADNLPALALYRRAGFRQM
ncbi:MAG: GNAT family N-acetyltransferase, partial [Planctomycetota bacterium]|nr:GNAT family N-acetyltransferase [Planctomycetota bacterium]